VSEKSTRKAPDYAVESRAARNRSVFRPQLQHWSCNTHQERYNSSESVQKKEIPVKGTSTGNRVIRPVKYTVLIHTFPVDVGHLRLVPQERGIQIGGV
jgi:hypothetical protein